MRELRLHNEVSETTQDAIPFPGRSAGGLTRRSPMDSIRMAERALESAQRGIDELHGLLDPIRLDPALFRFDGPGDDRGPSAA